MISETPLNTDVLLSHSSSTLDITNETLFGKLTMSHTSLTNIYIRR